MLRKILVVLRSIEGLLIDILFELKQLEGHCCEKNGDPGKAKGFVGERTSDVASETCCWRQGEGCAVREDESREWLAQGIDNILGYQVGKKRSEGE